MNKPLTDEQMWGCATDPTGETNCKNHPRRMGFVDLGQNTENRYPCYDCYLKMCQREKSGNPRKGNRSHV